MTVFRPLSFPAANTGFYPGFHSGAEVIPSATGRSVPDPLVDTPDCFVPLPSSVCFVESGEDAGSKSPELGFEQSWGRPISAYQAAYKVVSYGLNLKIDPDRKFISGFTDIVLRPSERLSEIELDLVDHYKVSKVVLVNGQETRELDYRHSSHKLTVSAPFSARPLLFNPNECYKIRVYYEGQPPVAVNPPWIGGFNWSRTDSGKAWVGVTSQNYGGKIWFPCKDHPSDRAESVTLNITVPEGLYVVSNGLLDGVTDAGDGFQTFHWQTSYPTSNYAISINVGDYQIDASTYGNNKIPLLFYSLREYQKADQDPKDPRTYEQKREDFLASAREYLDFLKGILGPIPGVMKKLLLFRQTILAWSTKRTMLMAVIFDIKMASMIFYSMNCAMNGGVTKSTSAVGPIFGFMKQQQNILSCFTRKSNMVLIFTKNFYGASGADLVWICLLLIVTEFSPPWILSSLRC